MKALAGIVFQLRQEQRFEANPCDADDTSRFLPCPAACGGQDGCAHCGGTELVRKPTAGERLDADPALRAAFVRAHEFLRTYSLIQRYKVTGAARLMGVRRFHPVFVEALEVFQGEMDRLEQEDRVARARSTQLRRIEPAQ